MVVVGGVGVGIGGCLGERKSSTVEDAEIVGESRRSSKRVSKKLLSEGLVVRPAGASVGGGGDAGDDRRFMKDL